MTPPLLKLVFVKGPKDGESLEYKPGSTIRVGRIVRGNEIAIKDAGISSKHLRIVSDSENWVIHDLGSSNGTILNSETLNPDTPVNLRHGDIIKLGEYTSIVVNFVTEDVQAPEEDKLPPRPRRNNRRVAVADPDPDPVESKPTRRGRSKKQDQASKEDEPPKRTRASARTRTLEDIAAKGKELEVEVNSRVSRSRKVAITNVVQEEEEVAEEKKGKSRVRRGKNTETVQNLIKSEIEDIPEEIEMNKATKGKQIENAGFKLVNVKSEDTVLEEEQVEMRASRATRSKKNEIAGDSHLNKAPKSRATRKKMETRIDDAVEEEALNSHVEEEDEKENEAEKEDELKRVEQMEIEVEEEEALNSHVEEEDEAEKEDEVERVEQVEIEVEDDDMNCSVRDVEEDNEAEKEDELERVKQVEIEVEDDDMNCSSVREDEETENLQDTIDEERNSKSKGKEARIDEEKVEQVKKIDLEKMTLGEWFDYMEVYLRKSTTEETEKLIEQMRNKALRVHRYIEEQKQKQKERVNPH